MNSYQHPCPRFTAAEVEAARGVCGRQVRLTRCALCYEELTQQQRVYDGFGRAHVLYDSTELFSVVPLCFQSSRCVLTGATAPPCMC